MSDLRFFNYGDTRPESQIDFRGARYIYSGFLFEAYSRNRREKTLDKILWGGGYNTNGVVFSTCNINTNKLNVVFYTVSKKIY